MPDHGHGTPIVPVVTEEEDSTFRVEPLNLWMPGLWDITIGTSDEGTPLDEAAFRFCIDG